MICTVVGARPNFMKMAPVVRELQRRAMPQCFVHTGQHYDAQMSAVFFDQLALPQPDVYLGVGSGSHGEQTARILVGFEAVCLERRPRLVVVAGDVNSTLACALAAAKLNIPIAHVEAGLRSFDRSMPEEVNRVLTDHLAELLFVTEPSGLLNLAREGVLIERVHFVGNSMIDSVQTHLPAAIALRPWLNYGYEAGAYGVVTLHRPSNVDELTTAQELADAIGSIARELPLVFPVHPRTLVHSNGTWMGRPGLTLVEPLGYLEFLGLMAKARLVITDSGGIQEETTALSVPCLTIRNNTERPITVAEGTNRLVPPCAERIVAAFHEPRQQAGHIPELWDGRASQRIVDVIAGWLESRTTIDH